METLILFAKLLILSFIVIQVAGPIIADRCHYRFIWSIWKRFRLTMLLEVIGILILTVMALLLLWQVSFLKYGWLNLIFPEGGNVLVGPLMEISRSPSTIVRLLVPFFFTIVLIELPFFARFEEKVFRQGYITWKAIAQQSIIFGLIHLGMGIPIAVGIALIVPGFFLGYKYKSTFDRQLVRVGSHRARKEALMVSTTYHTMYNSVPIIFLIIATL